MHAEAQQFRNKAQDIRDASLEESTEVEHEAYINLRSRFRYLNNELKAKTRICLLTVRQRLFGPSAHEDVAQSSPNAISVRRPISNTGNFLTAEDVQNLAAPNSGHQEFRKGACLLRLDRVDMNIERVMVQWDKTLRKFSNAAQEYCRENCDAPMLRLKSKGKGNRSMTPCNVVRGLTIDNTSHGGGDDPHGGGDDRAPMELRFCLDRQVVDQWIIELWSH
ncbi:hypothetical protein B0H10DRAFT_1940465 [Mycena sp. CBHHK59/15]|nr:hypothetical protein B0H10DRAFT_1940465 [Mycena sp. CBHHK59/15]